MKTFSRDARKYPYDAWLVWRLIEKCNLDCRYCFTYGDPAKKTARIPIIDTPSMMRTLEKTGKIFRIYLTGTGEPSLVPNIVEACAEITKKHYLTFNTNLTTRKIRDFVEKVDPGKVTEIIASCHIKELERHNLTDTYIENFLLCKERGFKIVAEVVGYPPILKEAKKYREFFRKSGIELKFRGFIGTYKGKEYPKCYTKKQLEILDRLFGNGSFFHRHGQFCNGGYNACAVDSDGIVYPCTDVREASESIGHIYKIIEFKKSLMKCPFDFCACPLSGFDPHLFERALKETAAASDKRGFIYRFASLIKNK